MVYSLSLNHHHGSWQELQEQHQAWWGPAHAWSPLQQLSWGFIVPTNTSWEVERGLRWALQLTIPLTIEAKESLARQASHTEYNDSGNSLTWQFNDKINIVVHGSAYRPCKDYAVHFFTSLVDQDVMQQYAHEVHCVHIMVGTQELSGNVSYESRWSWDHNLKHKLVDCHKEDKDLRCQMRHYCIELDNMCHRQYDNCHECCTSTKQMPSSAGPHYCCLVSLTSQTPPGLDCPWCQCIKPWVSM